MCLCVCTALHWLALLLLGVWVHGCLAVCMRVCQTLSSVQQLVDIEPSPVSAMRMTLAQVVITLVNTFPSSFLTKVHHSIHVYQLYVCANQLHLDTY